MTKLKVIDVSEHQGVIDWAKVKPNIDAAIIRCGYGDNVTSQDDARWAYNVRECERLGIPYGVYLYSYATSTAQIQSEIDHALRLLKGHKPAYPVYFDSEEPGTGTVARAYAKKFCEAIKAAGYTPGIYASEYWYNTYMSGLTAYPLWIAKYSSYSPSIGTTYEAWQFTSTGQIGGYSGALDVSWFYKDYAAKKPTTTWKDGTYKATHTLNIREKRRGTSGLVCKVATGAKIQLGAFATNSVGNVWAKILSGDHKGRFVCVKNSKGTYAKRV